MGSEPSPDPEIIQTPAELAFGLRQLYERRGLSYVRIAQIANLSPSTVHSMCSGQALPRRESLMAFTETCGADPVAWAEALRRVTSRRPRGEPTPHPARSGADVSIRLKPWVTFYGRSPYSNDLLRRVPNPLTEGQATGGHLGEFPLVLKQLTDCLVTVEVVTHYRGITVLVESSERFWTLVAADIVLRRFEGTRHWLLKQTEKIIRDDNQEHLEQLRLVWLALFELLLHSDTPERCDWPPRQLVEDVDTCTVSSPKRSRRIIDWLLDVFSDDRVVSSSLRRAWERYVSAKFPGLHNAGSRSFDPQLVTIGPLAVPAPGDEPRRYSFQAMCHPLTVGDMAILWPDRVPKGADPRLPYVLGGLGDERDDALGSFLLDLIGRCLMKTDSEPDKDWTWAVPTAPEWLALSGCAADGRPYPWGTEPPTPQHANLRFPGRSQKVRPVGLLHAGKSPAGVWDCCGNVHEVVEWQLGGLQRAKPTLTSLRLVGGSFRNRPENASCRVFRPFVPTFPDEQRQNVGLRLIRYRAEHAELRMEALKQFRRARATPRRTRRRKEAPAPVPG
ncbi:helix-turn-helix domain-containing protein [Streptomyces sp. NPDC005271]|uniref:helix-turn-helix domain-containing protein n=1 Tax=unclassified Streptomyces TaxID=2593676 RepID=UPI0033B9D826